MLGQMMQVPLLISQLIVHADRHHGDVEVVSRRAEGDIHRTTYRQLHRRARRLAGALRLLGLAPGDRVATLAWNGYRHLELYFAVPGAGSVLHTINPRLHADQIAWMLDHAGDRAVCFDPAFLPLVEAIAPRARGVRSWIALTDRERMPARSALAQPLCYEDLIERHADDFEWPQLDENAASLLCYTSGTTGDPKGVLYSHRSTVLHTLAAALPDGLNLSARDAILPAVPMFHVNAWGLPYAAAMVGAKLVLAGAQLDGKSLFELFEGERVSVSAGVPTIWQGLLAHMDATGARFTTMKRTIIGGSACPPAMLLLFQERYGVQVLHAWGMTETSPLGTTAALKHKHLASTAGAAGAAGACGAAGPLAVQLKQGRALYGIDMKITAADGAELPWDGSTSGALHVRGPWVVREYFNAGRAGQDADSSLRDGWFPTGDIATIDADGYMQITDRAKDMIKSGGEWISSIAIENIAVAHPAVALAACIAVRHPRWDERPLLVVVLKAQQSATREQLLAFFDGKVATWQVPDDVLFVESIPLGPTGKMLKARLREQLHDYRLPGT